MSRALCPGGGFHADIIITDMTLAVAEALNNANTKLNSNSKCLSYQSITVHKTFAQDVSSSASQVRMPVVPGVSHEVHILTCGSHSGPPLAGSLHHGAGGDLLSFVSQPVGVTAATPTSTVASACQLLWTNSRLDSNLRATIDSAD